MSQFCFLGSAYRDDPGMSLLTLPAGPRELAKFRQVL